MMQASAHSSAASEAFDALAREYDTTFTHSAIGRAQRKAVRECATDVFIPGSRLLELNCGTGEDAIYFARQGFCVTACDISPAMITQAQKKSHNAEYSNRLRFLVQATEEIGTLPSDLPFDGVFSNFSGLNCVKDLKRIADTLAPLLSPGAPLLLCFSTRYCAWEFFYYIMLGDWSRAFRRCSGFHKTKLGGVALPVYYPTLQEIKQSFIPHYRLVSAYGIGITVPPSYLEPWFASRSRLLRWLAQIDAAIRQLPAIRTIGDHMLLRFERLEAR